MRGLVGARWGLVRLVLAGFVVWALAVDTGSRLARLQLLSMPNADMGVEVEHLRERGRYAEAMVALDAGIEVAEGAERERLVALRAEVERERQSLLRRLKDVVRGAVSGGSGIGGQESGDASLELLLGAVVTDFLVIGDLRDLVIQWARRIQGESTDPVIVALSGIGIVTTVMPEVVETLE